MKPYVINLDPDYDNIFDWILKSEDIIHNEIFNRLEYAFKNKKEKMELFQFADSEYVLTVQIKHIDSYLKKALRYFEEIVIGAQTPLYQIFSELIVGHNINYIPLYIKSPQILLENIKVLFFGFGPGEFGSLTSFYSSTLIVLFLIQLIQAKKKWNIMKDI